MPGYPPLTSRKAMDRILGLPDAFFDDFSTAWSSRWPTSNSELEMVRFQLIQAVLNRIRTASDESLRLELSLSWHELGSCVRQWHRVDHQHGGPIQASARVVRLESLYAYALWLQGPRFNQLTDLMMHDPSGRKAHAGETWLPQGAEGTIGCRLPPVPSYVHQTLIGDVLSAQKARLSSEVSRFHDAGLVEDAVASQYMPELAMIRRALAEDGPSKDGPSKDDSW